MTAAQATLSGKATQGVSAAPATDRRIVRSKRALREALIELTEERGLDGFTVNDLCARADLNRGTFYNHYRDKDDFVADLEGDLFAHLEIYQAEMATLTLKEVALYRAKKKPMPFLVSLFDYLREQGEFLHAMLGPGGDASLGPRIRDSLCTNVVTTLLHEQYRESSDPFVGYYVAYYSSAYLGVITRWIETGMQESSEDMARIALRLLFIKPGESIKL